MTEKIREDAEMRANATRAEWGAEDGLSRELRALALGLVMQVPAHPASVQVSAGGALAAPEDGSLALFGDSELAAGEGVAIRLAEQADLDAICVMRCAQSVEYWGLAPADEAYRLFRAETEAYIRRNLNSRIFFALAERDGEIVSMAGLEIPDRLPSFGVSAAAERSATIVSCYTPPAHRQKGYMTQLLTAWSAIAPIFGIDALYLESRNASMQMLALDEGYEYVSEKYRLALTSLDSETAGSAAKACTLVEPAGLLTIG